MTADRTPLVIPPVDFDTPTGDELVAIDKGFGGGPVGGRKPPPFRPDWKLVVCRECRRRMFDGEGRSIHRMFTCIPTRARRRVEREEQR